MSDSKQTLNMLRPFYRGLPIIFFVMLVCVLAVKKYLNYVTPKYESVAMIKLADAAVGLAHANLYRNFDVFASSTKIGQEVEMVKSGVVVSKALDKLDLNITSYRIGEFHKQELYHDCPFDISFRPYSKCVYDSTYKLTISRDSALEIITPRKLKVLGRLNHLIKLPGMDIFIRKNDSLFEKKPKLLFNDRYEFILNSKEMLQAELSEKVDVMFLDKETPVLRVAFKTPVAQKSADIVLAISEAYINDYVLEKFSSADTTVNFLDKEVKKYSQKLAETENDLENFRTAKNVVNVKMETDNSLKKISELQNHLSGLEMDLVAIDSLDRYMKMGKDKFIELAPNFQTFNDLLSTEFIKKIKSLQSDKRDLLQKYTPENEKVKVVDDKLNDIYTYMQESVNNTRTNLQLKYDDLKKSILKAEAEFATFPNKDRNMTILERNFNLNDQNYRFLREKKTEAEIARAANLSFHRIITQPVVASKPVSPNPTLLKVLGGFLGFLGGTFFIYLVHGIKDRVNDDINIQRNSDTPIYAKVPFIKKAEQSDLTFQKIAIDLHVNKQLEPGSILCISSYVHLEGKRTMAMGFAKACVGLGKKTVLLDVDGNMPALTNSDFELVSLPALNSNWQQPKTLNAILAGLQKRFDVVIVKNTAIVFNSAALLLMAAAGFNLLVADTRRTKLKRVAETDMLKEKSGIQNIQFIVNRDGYTPNVIKQLFAFSIRFGKKKWKTAIIYWNKTKHFRK
jgi:uncharacterized protein involved in exopolysaccharide biosynthesis